MGVWAAYKDRIRKTLVLDKDPGLPHLDRLKNELFQQGLTYLIPLSFIAIIPGIIVSWITGFPVLIIANLVVLTSLFCIGFYPNLKIGQRKTLLVLTTYFISVVLLYYLGMMGPGLLPN